MNSISDIDLSKIRRCDQVWDDMPENEKGKLCLKCDKNIVDFRNKTKAEIAKAHVFSETNLCGIYNEKQVLPPSREIFQPLFKYHPSSLYLAFLSLLSLSVSGQSKKEKPAMEQAIKLPYLNFELNAPKSSEADVLKDSILVSGKVLDENGETIVAANIIVEGSHIGTSSDFDGGYQLFIPVELDSAKEITLIYKSIGYEDLKLIVSKELVLANNPVILDAKFINTSNETHILGMVGIVIEPPIHKKVWYRVRGFFGRLLD